MRNASSIFLLASLLLSLPAAQAQWITKKTAPAVYDSLRTATLNEVRWWRAGREQTFRCPNCG